MKRYLTIFVALFLFIIRVNAEDYETGELVSYKDIKFYVISDNDDYLTLLKATPLTVDEVNKYGVVDGVNYINKVTGYHKDYNGKTYESYNDEDYHARYGGYYGQGATYGYGGVAYYSSDICNEASFHIDCSGKDNYNDSDIKHIVDNWGEKILDNNDLVVDNKGYKVRLLTIDELKNKLGYDEQLNNINAPIFMKYYNFWIMGAYYISARSGRTYTSSVYYFRLGIRPVINLKKSEITNVYKLQKKKITDSEFKIGDIVEYNNVEYYVIKDSNKNDAKLTMVKRIPLTEREIKKYEEDATTFGTNYEMYDDRDDVVYTIGRVPYYYRKSSCSASNSGGSTIGCTTDYKKSDIKYIVDDWVEDYTNPSDLIEDELGYKSRLITINELKENLAYVGRGPIETDGITTTEYYRPSENTPFILSNCFTMSPVLDSNVYVYSLQEIGMIDSDYIYSTNGICPVITIKKTNGVNSNNNNNYTNDKVRIPDTLLKNPIFIVVIGIILIVIATITVSLILKRKK